MSLQCFFRCQRRTSSLSTGALEPAHWTNSSRASFSVYTHGTARALAHDLLGLGSMISLGEILVARAVFHFALGVSSLAVLFSSWLRRDSLDHQISLNAQLKVSILVLLTSLGCLSWISYLQPCRLCVPYFQYDRSTCGKSGISVNSLGQRA